MDIFYFYFHPFNCYYTATLLSVDCYLNRSFSDLVVGIKCNISNLSNILHLIESNINLKHHVLEEEFQTRGESPTAHSKLQSSWITGFIVSLCLAFSVTVSILRCLPQDLQVCVCPKEGRSRGPWNIIA